MISIRINSMHYDSVKNEHGLKHDPFKAIVTPRPIGWVSTVNENGVPNLAPYSFFNAVSDRPHYVMFVSSSRKDSLRNIEKNGEFTCSLSTWDTRDEMNISSAPVPPGADEFALAQLETAPSKFVAPPRVKLSPAAMECRHWKTVELPDVQPGSDSGHFMVIGQVVGIYINETFIKDGMVDTSAMRPLGRMGYMDYAVVTPETAFTLNRPIVDADGSVSSPSAKEWDGTYR
jgi:flavin reductase (DIM6/NTAB) family NADH-FMN oxidoreductase RutF